MINHRDVRGLPRLTGKDYWNFDTAVSGGCERKKAEQKAAAPEPADEETSAGAEASSSSSPEAQQAEEEAEAEAPHAAATEGATRYRSGGLQASASGRILTGYLA